MKPLSSSVLRKLNQCQNPSFVKNEYSGQTIKVDCGMCSYCIAKKAQKASLRVKTAGAAFKYCYFVTLTYNNDNIPLYHVKILQKTVDYADGETGRFAYDDERLVPLSQYQSSDDSEMCHVFFDQVQGTIPFDRDAKDYVPESANWFLTYGAIKSFVKKTENSSPYFASQKYGKDLIPFCNYVDVQNYIKRLRKHLSQYSNEKISFYAVSEYGPVHFRPHFHILLFFNSDEISEILSGCHYKSWKLGRSDIQRAIGGASSYVASYVNSLLSAPMLYRACKGFKPKSRASYGFYEKGSEFVENEDPYVSIEQKLNSCINGRDFCFGGIIVRSTPPLSYLRKILPRFSSVESGSCIENFGIVVSVATAFQRMSRYGIIDYDPSSVMSMVRAYCKYLSVIPPFALPDADKQIVDQCRVSTSFSYCLYNEDSLLKVYRLFLSVQNFLRCWNLPLLTSDLSAYYGRIKFIFRTGYFLESKRQLDSLNSDYRLLESEPDLSYSLFFFSPDMFVDLYKSELMKFPDIFNFLSEFNNGWVDRSIKHKKLNDINGVLNDMV